jgi:hypothetical protein
MPWLTLVGAALIAWVGADLIHADHLLQQWLPFLESTLSLWLLRVAAVAGVMLFGLQAQRVNRLREVAEDELRKNA